mgnify:CR=1 FL=1
MHGLGSPERYLLASVAAYIGIDPSREIDWVLANPLEWGRMLQAGEVDAIAGFPPMNYELHAQKAGRVILNTITDDPWRHYFCCLLAVRRQYLESYPVATKRALRAPPRPERTAPNPRTLFPSLSLLLSTPKLRSADPAPAIGK